MTVGTRVELRCAAHPARPAVDACPGCGRGRCAHDVAELVGRCPLCAREEPAPAAGTGRAALVAAGLAALAAALVGGWIATQYVRTHVMSLVAPALLGLAVSWAATAAAGRLRSAGRGPVVGLALAGALLGTALGFRLAAEPLTRPVGRVLPPYLCAFAGALAWPLVDAPARRPGRQEPAGSTSKR